MLRPFNFVCFGLFVFLSCDLEKSKETDIDIKTSKEALGNLLSHINNEDSLEVKLILDKWKVDSSNYISMLTYQYCNGLYYQLTNKLDSALVYHQSMGELRPNSGCFIDSLKLASKLEIAKIYLYGFNNLESTELVLDEIIKRRDGDYAHIRNQAFYYKASILRRNLLFDSAQYVINTLDNNLSGSAILDSQMWAKSKIIRANVYFDLGEFTKADSMYKNLIVLCENSVNLEFRVPFLLHVRSLILLNLGENEELLRTIERLISIDHSNRYYLFLYHYLKLYASSNSDDFMAGIEHINQIELEDLAIEVDHYLIIDYLKEALDLLANDKQFAIGLDLIEKYEGALMLNANRINETNMSYHKQKAIFLSKYAIESDDNTLKLRVAEKFEIIDSLLFSYFSNADSYSHYIELLERENEFYNQWIIHDMNTFDDAFYVSGIMDRRKINFSPWDLKHSSSFSLDRTEIKRRIQKIQKWCEYNQSAVISIYFGHKDQYFNVIDKNGSRIIKRSVADADFYPLMETVFKKISKGQLNNELEKIIDSISVFLWPEELLEINFNKIVLIPDHILFNFPFELIATNEGERIHDEYKVSYSFSLNALFHHVEKPTIDLKDQKMGVFSFSSPQTLSTQNATLANLELPGSIIETEILRNLLDDSGIRIKS